MRRCVPLVTSVYNNCDQDSVTSSSGTLSVTRAGPGSGKEGRASGFPRAGGGDLLRTLFIKINKNIFQILVVFSSVAFHFFLLAI